MKNVRSKKIHPAKLRTSKLPANADMDNDNDLVSASPEAAGARRGIQSLDAALLLLRTLASFGSAASLTDLSRAAHLPTSKAHRYLASFMQAGLVLQQG
jgi:hypothetical protein